MSLFKKKKHATISSIPVKSKSRFFGGKKKLVIEVKPQGKSVELDEEALGRRLFSLEDLVLTNAEDTILEAPASSCDIVDLAERVEKLEFELEQMDKYCKSLHRIVRDNEQKLFRHIRHLEMQLERKKSNQTDLFSEYNELTFNSLNSKSPMALPILRVESPRTQSLSSTNAPSPNLSIHNATNAIGPVDFMKEYDARAWREATRNQLYKKYDQENIANHPDVQWCAYYGDQKGFSCCLKANEMITGIKNYEDFLLKLEDNKP